MFSLTERFVFTTVVTFYATLGEEAIAFGLNETGVTHLVTSVELLETKLKVSFTDLLPVNTRAAMVKVMKHLVCLIEVALMISSDLHLGLNELVCTVDVL